MYHLFLAQLLEKTQVKCFLYQFNSLQVRGEVKLEDLIEKFKRFQEEYVRDTESAEEF